MRFAAREVGAVLLGIVGATVMFARWNDWPNDTIAVSTMGLLGMGVGFGWQAILRRDPVRDLSIIAVVALLSLFVVLVGGLMSPENVTVRQDSLGAWFGFAMGIPLGHRWLERRERLRRVDDAKALDSAAGHA